MESFAQGLLTLQAERVVFQHEIGVALLRWSEVETALYGVLCNCIDQKDWRQIGRGYFSIENFRSRLAFADELLSGKYPPGTDNGDRWAALYKRILSGSSSRNRLVHRPAVELPLAVSGRRIALVEWLPKKPTHRERDPQHPPGSICTSDIIAMGREFHALAYDLMAFNERLAGGPRRLFQRPRELAEHQPTIEQTRNRIGEELGLRRGSKHPKNQEE